MNKYAILGLGLFALSLTSCVSNSTYEAMVYSRDSLQTVYNNYTSKSINREKDLSMIIEEQKAKITTLESELASAKSNYNKLKNSSSTQSQDLMSQIEELQKVILQNETKLRQSELKLDEYNKIMSAREEKMKALRNTLEKALLGFSESGLTVSVKNGLVYVSLSNQLLFSSGSTEIDKLGKSALLDLAKVLNEQADLSILVEGHTDNQAVRGGQRFADNWDLSVLRATEVARYLSKDGGVDAKRLIASGRSEYLPIYEGDSKEARASNRRTEIILKPKLDELYNIIND